jgi:hypothetical protein
MADDIDKKREKLKAEYDLNQLILKSAQANLIVEKSGLDIKNNLVAELQSQSSVSSKIESLNTSIDKLLLEQVKSGTDVNEKLIERLSSTKDVLKQHQKEAKLMDAQKAYLAERKKGLKNIFGITSDIEDAVLNGTFKALAMNKAFENIGASVSRMGDSVQDSVKNLGLSGASAMELQGNIEQARFSMTGLLYGSEAVAASGKAIAEKYGSASMATADLIEGVTQLSSLGLDASEATDLASVFKSAGVEATEVKGVISDIAKKEGISAKKAMEGMSGQMSQLVGKSEAQLKTIIKSNAQLVKQGTTLAQIEDISNNMLDIETSLKAGAKARMMLGRDMNTTAVRDASMALQSARSDDERAAARKKISEEILKGVGGMEEFAQMTMKEKEVAAAAYGMSRDELSTMMEKKKVNDEMVAQYGDQAEFMQGVIGGAKQAAAATADFVIELGKAAAKMVVMNVMQGKGTGLKNLIPGMGGKGGGGGGQTDLSNSEAKPTKASQGSGKGLKSLAGGLKAMGSGKVLAGIFNMALAGPALLLSLPAIPFLLFMGKVKLKALKDNFTGLGRGLSQMTQAAVGALVLLLAIPALALGMLAIPFLLFMSIPGLGAALTTNFAGLAAGLAAFGNPATAVFVLIGIGLLAALGVAMIPFAYSLSLLSPLVEAFGNIFIGVFAAIPPIITAVADGLVNMMNAVTMENVGAMLLLGPALMGVAFGLAAIGMMGVPGLLALTGLGAVTVLLAPTLMGIADSIGNMMGGGSDDTDSNSDNSDSKLIDAINGLRGDIQSQPILISVDGKVVSEITKIQSRQGVSKNVYRK